MVTKITTVTLKIFELALLPPKGANFLPYFFVATAVSLQLCKLTSYRKLL